MMADRGRGQIGRREMVKHGRQTDYQEDWRASDDPRTHRGMLEEI